MPIFNYYQDQKQTIWTRTFFTVNANTEKEALSILRQHYLLRIEDLEEQFPEIISITEGEMLFDTMEHMTPGDNGDYSTIEVYNEKNNFICDNSSI